MNKPMNQQEIAQNLQHLNSHFDSEWVLSGDSIRKDFQFDSFKEALHFMQRVGRHAEELKHHPDWCNAYNKVSIALTTHGAGGITMLDFWLAARIEGEYYPYRKPRGAQ